MPKTHQEHLKRLQQGIESNWDGDYEASVKRLRSEYKYFAAQSENALPTIKAALYLGVSYYSLGDYSRAKKYLKKAAHAARQLKEDDPENHLYLSMSLYYLGKTVYQLKETDKGFSLLQEGLILTARYPGDRAHRDYQVKINLQLGRWLREGGHYDQEARNCMEQAFNLHLRDHAHGCPQFSVLEIAFIFFEKEDYAGAERQLRLAHSFYRKSKDTANLALTLQLLGIALVKQHKADEGVLAEAQKIYKRNPNQYEESVLLLILAIADYQYQGGKNTERYLKQVVEDIDWLYINGHEYLFLVEILLKNEKLLQTFASFRQLDTLHRFKFRVQDTETLQQLMADDKELKHAEITVEGPKDLLRLGEALQKNSALKSLKITYAPSYREAEEKGVGKFKLTGLESAHSAFTKGFRHHTRVTDLILDNIPLSSANIMAKSLQEHKTLQSLTFSTASEEKANDLVLATLLSSLHPHSTLTNLALRAALTSTSSGSSLAITALAALLATSRKLQHLTLEDTHLTPKDCQLLVKSLAESQSLQTLVFTENSATSGHAFLVELARGNHAPAKLALDFQYTDSNLTEKIQAIHDLAALIRANLPIHNLSVNLRLYEDIDEANNPSVIAAFKDLEKAFAVNTQITELGDLFLIFKLESNIALRTSLQAIQATVRRNQEMLSKTVTPKPARSFSQQSNGQKSIMEIEDADAKLTGEELPLVSFTSTESSFRNHKKRKTHAQSKRLPLPLIASSDQQALPASALAPAYVLPYQYQTPSADSVNGDALSSLKVPKGQKLKVEL